MGLLPMDADILPPSDDRIFKLLLTHEKAKRALMHLISCIIGRTVVDVKIHNVELVQSDTKEKAVRFDINCTLDDGSQVNLEMQASRIAEYRDRLFRNVKGKYVFYLTDLYTSQPAKGEMRYDKLARTYQITFCTYTIFPETEAFVNSFSLRHDTTGELLTDMLSITFIELSRLGKIVKKPVNEMTGLEKWAIFFRYAADRRYREIVNRVIDSEEVLQVAGNLLMNISQNEEERALFRSRRKYETDMQSNMRTERENGIEEGIAKGRAEGIEEGRAEGIEEGIMGVARSALRRNYPIEEVAEITGLAREVLEQLAAEQ